MRSGNFLIGKDLSLEGFDVYVQPLFKEKGYLVQDKIAVPYNDYQKTILTSVVGEGDLEKEVNNMLIQSGKIIKEIEENRAKRPTEKLIANEYQVSVISGYKDGKDGCVTRIYKGVYETIGLYHYQDIASQIFPLIAQRYLLDKVKTKADEVVQQVKELFDKKLGEL